ncbi:MFS transporter [Actinomadura fulvescens]|uniref:Major facilitator superfamily (MFS) profile domain-containing protein n=1 Tax=Actinomadura fulvescens TaxID=46160 RepID=A0ABN3P8G8_9ACTN
MTSDTETTTASPPKVNPGLVLLLCSGATFMAFLDLSVVNIAFVDILADFPGTESSTLTWVVSGYAVTFAAFLTPAGRLADTLGRREVFFGSLAGFTVASVICAAAPNPEVLIAGRVVQGAFAAGMIPAALGLLIQHIPFENLIKAIGTWSAVGGFSAVVGPIVGGVLVDAFGWRSVFYVNVPVGIVLVLGTLSAMPRIHPPAGLRHPDLLGSLILVLGIGGVVAALTEGENWGWTDTRTLALLIGGVLLGLVALVRSRGHEAPAIATNLWASSRFAVVNLASLIFGVAMFAWLLTGPLLTTQVWRWSIMESAGALSIGAVVSMVASVAAGRVSDPTKHRWVIALGSLLFAGCNFLMASDLFGTEPRFWDAWVPASILGGAGLGLGVAALSAAAATALPPLQFAAGVGMNMTARQLGGALGIAGMAAILTAGGGTRAIDAFHDVYLACAAVAIVAAIVAVLLPAPATAEQ